MSEEREDRERHLSDLDSRVRVFGPGLVLALKPKVRYRVPSCITYAYK